jgi:hypothetical protein
MSTTGLGIALTGHGAVRQDQVGAALRPHRTPLSQGLYCSERIGRGRHIHYPSVMLLKHYTYFEINFICVYFLFY